VLRLPLNTPPAYTLVDVGSSDTSQTVSGPEELASTAHCHAGACALAALIAKTMSQKSKFLIMLLIIKWIEEAIGKRNFYAMYLHFLIKL